MLKVTIQLIPYGLASNARTIAEMEIVNNLSNPNRPELGNYDARIFEEGKPGLVLQKLNYTRSQSVWNLVREFLNHAHEVNLKKESKK